MKGPLAIPYQEHGLRERNEVLVTMHRLRKNSDVYYVRVYISYKFLATVPVLGDSYRQLTSQLT